MRTNFLCIIVMLAVLFVSEEASGGLVYPRLLESRSTDGSKVVQIDHQLTLTLEETSLFHDRLELSVIENGEYVIKSVPSTMYSRHLRQDKEHLASVMLYETSQGTMLTGILNSSHLIEPLRVLQRDVSGTIPHKIQRIAGEIPYASIEQRALKDLLRPRNFATVPPKTYTLEMALFADRWAQKKCPETSKSRNSDVLRDQHQRAHAEAQSSE
uniref:Putative tick metalloprotease n=1 Tax=Ixodes ricinus TaxID=34613 RepID=V5H894_IXORI